jgi:hypothetical protein
MHNCCCCYDYVYNSIQIHTFAYTQTLRYLPDAVDSVKGKAQIPVHRKLHDRLSAAAQLVQDKGLRGDVVVDSMDNSVRACEGVCMYVRMYVCMYVCT